LSILREQTALAIAAPARQAAHHFASAESGMVEAIAGALASCEHKLWRVEGGCVLVALRP